MMGASLVYDDQYAALLGLDVSAPALPYKSQVFWTSTNVVVTMFIAQLSHNRMLVQQSNAENHLEHSQLILKTRVEKAYRLKYRKRLRKHRKLQCAR